MTRRREKRRVRSDDPSFSDEANELLTSELREAVGEDVVEVPEDTPRRSQREHPRHGPYASALLSHPSLYLVTLSVAVVVGAIAGMSTGHWFFLILALALHALGTVVVVAGALRMTTRAEHVTPEVGARLQNEGISDPDGVLNELIEEFQPGDPEQPGGLGDLGGTADTETHSSQRNPAAEIQTVVGLAWPFAAALVIVVIAFSIAMLIIAGII